MGNTCVWLKCGGRGRGLWGGKGCWPWAPPCPLREAPNPEPRTHPRAGWPPAALVFTGRILNQNTFFADTFLEDKLESLR